MAVTELVNSGNYSNGRYLYRFTDSGSSDEDSAWSVAEDPQLCETQSLCDATDRLELGPHKVEDDDAAPLLDPRFYNECEEQYLLDNYEVVQQACRDQIATFITQEGSEALQRMLSDRWDFLPNPDPLMAILRFYVLSLRVCSRGSADSLHMKQLLSLLRVSDGIGLALDVLDTMRKENSPPDVKIADMTAMTVQILARMIKDDVEFHCEVHNMQQFAALKNHVMHKNMPYCSSTIRAQSAWRSLTALLRYRAQQGQPEDIPTPTGTTASGMLTPRLSKPVSYDFYMELPGHLSLLGPRHSNDHADIRDIAVAPTLDEIMCPRPAYLPQLDHLAWYVEGMEGMYDRQFRLMRENVFAPVKNILLHVLLGGPKHPKPIAPFIRFSPCRMTFIGMNFGDVVVNMSFPKLMGPNGRPALGSLWVVLVPLPPLPTRKSQRNHVASDKDKVVEIFFFQLTRCPAPENRPSVILFGDPSANHEDTVETARLKLLNSNDTALSKLLYHYEITMQYVDLRVVQCSDVLPATFTSMLDFLKNGDRQISHRAVLEPQLMFRGIPIQPPRYVRRPPFEAFHLASTTTDGRDIRFHPDKPFDMDLYLKHSKLDASQAKALLNGLSRSIALLQGPPGTGKSFTSVALINTLIDSGLANDAPILCVAFTNHAVDQILNRLIAQGVAPSKILRLGPNSLLTTVAKESSLTPNKPFGNDSFRHLRDIRKELTQHLQTYASQARIVAEGITLALNPLLEEAWDYAAQQKAQCQDPTKAFYRFLTGRVPRRTPEHHSGVTFTEENRQQIGRQWFDIAVQARSEKSGEILQRYSAESGRMGKDAKSVTASDIRQSFRVMGVTTSSLANRLDLIRAVRPKILICEEAAETLEAHSLISLLPSVEHVLMNGDHKQLRPVVSSYELTAASQEGRAISYDISLFERMVAPPPDLAATNVLPYDTLEIQRRMTPDVSKLIRKSVYPFLQDGESVHDYPLVPGMLNRVFWQHHYFGEESDEESFFNPFEVDMVTALVKYLTECGTKAQNIAVITPYKYQMQRLKQAIYSALQVRPYDPLAEVPTIVTVDEFQGCEADVVVVSMVRSNEKHECGFLKIQNRVNVMLSRAKHAMYIVGNADTASRGPMLGEVVEQLRSARLVGPAFMTACHRHPGEAVPAAMPGDLSEQAVCRSLCNVTMACGHPCVKSCHGDAHQCRAICKKPLPQCGHPCTQQCGVACTAICLVVVETASSDVTLTCGHPAPANATCHDFSHGLVQGKGVVLTAVWAREVGRLFVAPVRER
ncbi:hypothetical protein CXG81DRAFT_20201 [Caulochytrium protostelioides]|uniref:P-loop containing nucleoside triphosphate hydrolase protein n=1 Tax=Caulochytrium protostelioides TaxID=1555241 RepID=A0A4P9X3Y8_9FUNG|nr:hypothetical protein CXG81DRAFT_20201 [Caulochytrium protostelioides]|eukprot:RKO99765.1 hypothetical protein CXG81DRAFT_20201 [Caulochytrium protostelioides]